MLISRNTQQPIRHFKMTYFKGNLLVRCSAFNTAQGSMHQSNRKFNKIVEWLICLNKPIGMILKERRTNLASFHPLNGLLVNNISNFENTKLAATPRKSRIFKSNLNFYKTTLNRRLRMQHKQQPSKTERKIPSRSWWTEDPFQ